MYHGTVSDFNIFNKSSGALCEGIYFSEYKEYAKGFTYSNGQSSGKIVECYIDCKNPYFVDYPDNYNTDELKAKGYDAVYHKNTGIIMVFEPNQIKSATDNIGTFDTANDDIRFQASKIVSKKEQMRKDDRLQLDKVVMQKQAPYIADNLPLPKMQGNYTNNYYVIWYNIDHG
ncbi:MAG: hypothetical protein SPL89_09465, partial [Clostridia bacterium]|nr:hypothetical protein [Clostridia bacterium]